MDKAIAGALNQLGGWPLEVVGRMGVAFLAGAILGAEREQHGRAAGFRTTILVCLAACVAMVLSESFYLESLAAYGSVAGPRPDPARLAAGALSGMGFLGAGVIIHQANHVVRGVTTAATLWFATVIGLALGAGHFFIGLVATAFAFGVLYSLPWVESHIRNDWYADATLRFDASATSLQAIEGELQALGIKVKGVTLQFSKRQPERKATLHLKFKKNRRIHVAEGVVERLGVLPGVLDVEWDE